MAETLPECRDETVKMIRNWTAKLESLSRQISEIGDALGEFILHINRYSTLLAMEAAAAKVPKQE